MPRGEEAPSASGTVVTPGKFENRTVTETIVCCRCGALLTDDAASLGRKTPVRSIPLAWTARASGFCFQKTPFKASTSCSGVECWAESSAPVCDVCEFANGTKKRHGDGNADAHLRIVVDVIILPPRIPKHSGGRLDHCPVRRQGLPHVGMTIRTPCRHWQRDTNFTFNLGVARTTTSVCSLGERVNPFACSVHRWSYCFSSFPMVSSKVFMSSACSSSLARIPSIIRLLVGSLSAR